uniref:Aquaporin-4 n=1 Tax=Mola mola TaxID=94237 RepID=A0A3Q3VYV0_MOLML
EPFEVLEMGKPDEGVTSRMNRWCSASARRDFFEQRLQPCLAELLGTAVFVCVGCVSGVRSVGVADGIQSALAHGLALGVLILIFGPISGGHFNPAVSVSAYLCGGLELRLLPAYILAQLFGGVVGAGLAKVSKAVAALRFALIALTVAEVILTSFLTSVVCMGAINSQTRSILAPFGIGLTVTAGAICGACMNPARAFGPAIIAGHWDKHWVYWIGPVCGALITAFHIRFLFGDRETRIVSK